MFRIRALVVVAGLAAMVATSAACNRGATPSNAPTLAAGQTTRSLAHDGRTRTYVVYVPASLDHTKPAALMVDLHGGTGNAEAAIKMTGFNTVADAHGFIVVYPNGTGRLSDDKLLTWNGGACCGYAQQQNVDDVGFIRAMVTDMEAVANIDAKRIYATGMSNGAILAQRLGCEAADVFAAIAPDSGTLNFSPCKPSEPVSVIEFHGTADQHIPYDGGYGPESLVNVNFASVASSTGFWTTFDGCGAQPQRNDFSDIQHQTWSGCANSTSVELYTIVGGGHAWPGGQGGFVGSDDPTTTIDASQLIWEFAAAHPKP